MPNALNKIFELCKSNSIWCFSSTWNLHKILLSCGNYFRKTLNHLICRLFDQKFRQNTKLYIKKTYNQKYMTNIFLTLNMQIFRLLKEIRRLKYSKLENIEIYEHFLNSSVSCNHTDMNSSLLNNDSSYVA